MYTIASFIVCVTIVNYLLIAWPAYLPVCLTRAEKTAQTRALGKQHHQLRRLLIDAFLPHTYCWSSAGDDVDLLSLLVLTTLAANVWCITNPTHVWRVSLRSIL